VDEQKKRDLKLTRKKPYLLRRGSRGAVITIPTNFLSLSGMEIGDKVYLYIDGDDLVVSKNLY